MPTYRIREYYSYYDEYLVDAPDEATATALVDTFNTGISPTTQVEQTEERTCDDYVETTVDEEEDEETEPLGFRLLQDAFDMEGMMAQAGPVF